MAINLITGVPGAGKSYLAVNMIIQKYCNNDNGIYHVKPEYTIITNIDGLKIDCLFIDQILDQTGLTVDQFFTVDYQKQVTKKYKNIVYLLDECQTYFRTGYKNNDVFFFFEYHRHLGITLFLVTQSKYLLPKQITVHCETETRAVRRTLSFFGEFKYNILSEGEIIDRKLCKPKKQIFDLYKSQESMEVEKPKNPMKKYGILLFLFIAISGYFAYDRVTSWGKPKKANAASITKKQSYQPINQKPNVINQSQSYNQTQPKPTEEHVIIKLNYAKVGSVVMIENPYTNSLEPLLLFEIKNQVYKINFNGITEYHTKIPSSLLDDKKSQQDNQSPIPINHTIETPIY
jgi:zona occludens toxin (predicted ATPase)